MMRDSPVDAQLVFHRLSDAICVVDARFNVLLANETYAKMAGVPLDRLPGRKCYDVFGGSDCHTPNCPVQAVLDGGAPSAVEQIRRGRFGFKCQCLVRGSPLLSEDGDLMGVIETCSPISDRHEHASGREQIEHPERMEGSRSIRPSIEGKPGMLFRSQRFSTLETLAASMAHEFNNLHAAVLGHLELALSKAELDAKTRSRLEEARLATIRASSVIQQLLTFARVDPSDRRVCDLNAIVENTVDLVAKEFESQGIELDFARGEVPPMVLDEGQIRHVTMNLILNARDGLLGRDVKRILLATGTEGDRAYLEVQDTGRGIPAHSLKRIFEPFFTTKGEHAADAPPIGQATGIGLGLNVCETIVKDHGGEIGVESEVGSGTTVVVRLPLGEDVAPPGEDLAGNPPERQAKVLVLDDEKSIRLLLCDLLEEWGHSPESTDNGADALRMLETERFDLALVDLQMPAMSGVEFLDKISTRPLVHRPVVIVMTGKRTNANLEGYRDFEVFDTVAKPFNLASLKQRVQAALNKARSAS